MIEAIKQALREMMQQLIERGAPLTNEMRQNIAQVMEHAATRIAELRNQETPPAPPEEPSIQSTPDTLGTAPSPDAQLLWILSGQNEKAFLEYLTTYPTAETQGLLRNPLELQRVIGFLNRMMPPGEPLVVDGMPHADLNSSNVWGMQYDPKSRRMKVRFQSGAEYIYDGIPQNIYNAFKHGDASATTTGSNKYGAWWKSKNPSIGAALNQYIKAGGFPYQRVR